MKIPGHKEVKHPLKQRKNKLTDVFKNEEKTVTWEDPCRDRVCK